MFCRDFCIKWNGSILLFKFFIMKKLLMFFFCFIAITWFSSSFAYTPPSNCKSYFDGCNQCGREVFWGEMACTMMACEKPLEPKCLEYFDESEMTWSGQSSSLKACTKEYAPVCAQPPMPDCPEWLSCIQVMPKAKTYSNKCMAESVGAEVLYSWECWDIKENEIACPMDAMQCSDGSYVGRTGPNCEFVCPETSCSETYSPVCWIDGRTYENTCKAKNIQINYTWACIWRTNETNIKTQLYKVIEQKTSSLSLDTTANILEKVILKTQLLASKQKDFSLKQTLFHYVSKLIRSYLQEKVYTPYIKQHFSEIFSIKNPAGNISDVNWIGDNQAQVSYEDNEVVSEMEVIVWVENGKIYMKTK